MTINVGNISYYLSSIGHGCWAILSDRDNGALYVQDQTTGERACGVYADTDRTIRALRTYVERRQRRA